MSLCSNATVDEGLYGDPTEIALVAMANNFNMHKAALEEKTPRVDELPFDSVRKMMSTKHQDGKKSVIYTKGALDSILKNTTSILENGKVRKITKADIDKIYKVNSEFSFKALRVLALAYSEDSKITEKNLIFVGLVAMIDPARKEAKPAVAEFKKAGITTIMITGDHRDTAFAIAKELGIAETPDQCIMGQELDGMTEEEIDEILKFQKSTAGQKMVKLQPQLAQFMLQQQQKVMQDIEPKFKAIATEVESKYAKRSQADYHQCMSLQMKRK